jgi:transcriptional regulator with XRE-family HTH domain
MLSQDAQELRRSIGSNIRAIRESKAWSQEKLAVRSRLSLNYVGNLERGRMNVSADTLSRIASALGVQVQTLVSVPQPPRTLREIMDEAGKFAKEQGLTRRIFDEIVGE